MFARVPVVPAALGLLACGAGSPPPSPRPPAAPAAVPSPTPGDGRCLASLASAPAPGWIEHGRIAVALEDGRPTSLEAIDASGAVVARREAPKTKEAARVALKELTCRLGGTLAMLEGAATPALEPSEDAARASPATATFLVLVPPKVDEEDDLELLCRAPARGADDARSARLTLDELEQRLTSRRWRAWLFDLADEQERTSGSERMMLHWRKADELAESFRRAGGPGPCWFATQLRSPKG